MTITKKITDDKKEKHSSFELSVTIPVMEVPQELKEAGGYVYEENTEYVSYHGSLEEANRAFMILLEAIAKHHNKRISDINVLFEGRNPAIKTD